MKGKEGAFWQDLSIVANKQVLNLDICLKKLWRVQSAVFLSAQSEER